jgi:signal peptide peptidase SppA
LPFPNEHSCRLADPSQYDKMRRQNNAGEVDGRRVDHIIGVKGGMSERQAVRYPLSAGWSGGGPTRRAREHCDEQDGEFEPAQGEGGSGGDDAMLQHRPWAIRQDMFATIMAALRADGDSEAAPVGQPSRAKGAVAVVPIQGVITPRPGLLGALLGIDGSLQRIRRGLAEALADESVGAIVLDVDSPGGAVDGVPEAAFEIRQARDRKPIVAAANTQMGSAAYWLASQASEISVTPSGEAGSIGVFAAHQDISGRLEQMGVDVTLISAGRHKTEGNPYEPLSETARDAIQSEVDAFYDMFVDDVAKGRDVTKDAVANGFGEGRMVLAQPAVTEGMADQVETVEAAIARASDYASRGRARGARNTQDVSEQGLPDEALANSRVRDALAGRS